MMFRALLLTTVVMGLSLSPAFARNSAVSLRDRQQAACYDDAQRLCGQFVPDVSKVTACMKTKRSQVGPKCAAAYKMKR